MANFKTHLNGGIFLGALLAAGGFLMLFLNLFQTITIFLLGTIGALLPDMDSDTGKPLHLIFQIISILIPASIYFNVAKRFSSSPEFLLSYMFISFMVINYVFCGLIKKFTIHRGIFHSIPMAVIFGQCVYLLFASSGNRMGIWAATAIFLGFILHLLLDEINSVEFKFIFPKIKKSFGTALKLKSDAILVNILVYALIIVLTSAMIVMS